MKEVILSADNKAKIYLVPNKVADNLLDYCHDFAANWIWKDPNGQKLLQYIEGMKVAVYNESDFINYLNIRIIHSLIYSGCEIICKN